MKKRIWILLAVCLIGALLLSGAAAEGEYTVIRQDFRISESSGTVYLYAYAMVQNTGDAPIYLNKAQIEFINDAGDVVVQSQAIVNLKPETLMPGEYGYLSSSDWGKDFENTDTITAINVILEGQKTNSSVQRFSCETEWLPDYPIDQWFMRNYMLARITNDTDETVYGFSCVLTLTDAEGRILYSIGESVNANIGIPPGGSIIVRKEVQNDIIEGIPPEELKVDAIAYKISY